MKEIVEFAKRYADDVKEKAVFYLTARNQIKRWAVTALIMCVYTTIIFIAEPNMEKYTSTAFTIAVCTLPGFIAQMVLTNGTGSVRHSKDYRDVNKRKRKIN